MTHARGLSARRGLGWGDVGTSRGLGRWVAARPGAARLSAVSMATGSRRALAAPGGGELLYWFRLRGSVAGRCAPRRARSSPVNVTTLVNKLLRNIRRNCAPNFVGFMVWSEIYVSFIALRRRFSNSYCSLFSLQMLHWTRETEPKTNSFIKTGPRLRLFQTNNCFETMGIYNK